MLGILGKKLGMTQIFKEDGRVVPVTVMEAGPCVVLDIKTKQKNGYDAIQLGFEDKKELVTNEPDLGRFKKANTSPKRFVRELRVEDSNVYKLGQVIDVSIFQVGDFVDVTGISIGKGFQGGVKRHHWAGGEASHGSMFHRAPGSIGASSFPSRVVKGHRLPGHMGAVKRTVQNLEVVKIDKENNLLVIKGSVPGKKYNFLVIKSSKKIPRGSKEAKRRLSPTPPPKKREGAKTAGRRVKK